MNSTGPGYFPENQESWRLTTDGQEPKLLLGRNLNPDGKRRVANVMLSREPFTAPERFYRPVDTFRTAPFPRVPSVTRGAVGAGIVVTPEGVSRLECRNVCTVVVAWPLHSLSGLSHPKEISVPIITMSTNNRISKGEVHKHRGQNQVVRAIR